MGVLVGVRVWLWLQYILAALSTASLLSPSTQRASSSSALLLFCTKNESQTRLIEDIEKCYRLLQ